MKKLNIVLAALAMFQVGSYFADIIKVSNNTPNTIFVAVYEELKGENPTLFVDKKGRAVITLAADEIGAIERPSWGYAKRMKTGNNRNLYFDSGTQGKGRLAQGVIAKNFVNIGEKKGDAFAIYPVMDDGETPSYMGQELKGTTQKDFDDNIKKEIHG